MYEGEWRDGHKEGAGKLTTADGDVFEGQFKGGKREGEGTERMAGGGVYEGQWRAGVKVRVHSMDTVAFRHSILHNSSCSSHSHAVGAPARRRGAASAAGRTTQCTKGHFTTGSPRGTESTHRLPARYVFCDPGVPVPDRDTGVVRPPCPPPTHTQYQVIYEGLWHVGQPAALALRLSRRGSSFFSYRRSPPQVRWPARRAPVS